MGIAKSVQIALNSAHLTTLSLGMTN